MKIVHIASGDLWAGAEKQLYLLASALQRLDDVEVVVVLFNSGQLADNLTAAGIQVYIFDESELSAPQLFRQIRQLLSRERPDIVHTHRNKENFLGGLAAASLGIPSLRTSHGSSEHPTGLLDLRRRLQQAADYLTGRLLQRRVVAVSRPLCSELAQRFGAAHVALVHNGIEASGSAPTRERGADHRWRIGIVGRLVPVKRVDVFIEVAHRLDRQLDASVDAEFLVVGDGPLCEQLHRQAEAMSWQHPISFTGHIADAETAIAELDILVICSDHEGLPMVALEAFKAGTVVVTHRIGGLTELLDEGRCGVLLDSQSPQSFAGAIATAVARPQRLASLADAAAQRLAEHYSSQAMAHNYAALYRSIAE